MDTTQRGNSDYMTVGEMAAKAGVTVRTVQYYDQKGLLMPSAKGSRNLRLYTSRDLDRLYRILCYKFLGLSLDEIRKRIDQEENADTTQQIAEELQKRIKEEEQVISEGMKRYALLKDLQSYTDCHGVGSWGSYAELIGYLQEKWSLVWEVNRAYEDGRLTNRETGTETKLKEYYRLIIEAIRLIREEIPPTSEEAMEIVARYEKMNSDDSEVDASKGKLERKALIKVDPQVMATDVIDYTGIWQEIREYFHEAGENYRRSVRGSETAEQGVQEAKSRK